MNMMKSLTWNKQKFKQTIIRIKRSDRDQSIQNIDQ